MKRIRWWIGIPMLAAAALIGGCLATSGRSLPEPVENAFHEVLSSDPGHSVTNWTIKLYSLEPGVYGDADVPDAKTFHGHKILGETRIEDTTTRKRIYSAFRRGVNDHDGSVAACFTPHHGLQLQTGKSFLDMVICFKCAQVKVWKNGRPEEPILISTSPRATFNEILRAAKVPLSKDAE